MSATRSRARIMSVTLVVTLAAATAALAASRDPAAGIIGCTRMLSADRAVDALHRMRCVRGIATTLLEAEAHRVHADTVPLDPRVAVYTLGQQPAHRAGGAARERAALRASPVRRIDHVQWTVDGDVAFAVYRTYTRAGDRRPASYVATRVTLRRGLVWEVLRDVQQGRPSIAGFPNTPVVAVTGPPATVPDRPDYDNAFWCSDRIAVAGDDSMTPSQHRRCVIAIASTYVDAEENSAPGNQILFDPRFSRYSLGADADHQPSNSDLIRTQEGRYQGTYNRVIRRITNRQWTVQGDTAWIVYDGYLVVSTTHPGFHVAERFRIRDGLIWEILIAPVQTSIL